MKVGTHENAYRTFVGNAIYVSVPRLIDPRVTSNGFLKGGNVYIQSEFFFSVSVYDSDVMTYGVELKFWLQKSIYTTVLYIRPLERDVFFSKNFLCMFYF